MAGQGRQESQEALVTNQSQRAEGLDQQSGSETESDHACLFKRLK